MAHYARNRKLLKRRYILFYEVRMTKVSRFFFILLYSTAILVSNMRYLCVYAKQTRDRDTWMLCAYYTLKIELISVQI